MSEKLRQKLNNWIKTLDSKIILKKDLKNFIWTNKDYRTEGQLRMATVYLESLGYKVVTRLPTTKPKKPKKEPVEVEIDENEEYEEFDIDLLNDLMDGAVEEEQPQQESAISTDSVAMYLRDLNTVDTSLLTQEQEQDLIIKAQAGDSFAFDDIIYHNTKLVINIAKKYKNKANGILGFEDLIQEGNLGLMEAVEKFNPQFGFKFSTYSTWWIKQKILRCLSNDSRTIRLPVHTVEMALMIKRIQKDYYDIHEEVPTDQWIADYINQNGLFKRNNRKLPYSAKDIQTILDYWNNQTPVSLSKPVGEDEDSTLGDFIPSNLPSPTQAIEKSYMAEDIRKAIDDVLNDRERKVICLRFGINRDRSYTLEEIGNILDVSRERIRQIESKALRKLSRGSQAINLRGYLEGINE